MLPSLVEKIKTGSPTKSSGKLGGLFKSKKVDRVDNENTESKAKETARRYEEATKDLSEFMSKQMHVLYDEVLSDETARISIVKV
jgi:hypothetical protein